MPGSACRAVGICPTRLDHFGNKKKRQRIKVTGPLTISMGRVSYCCRVQHIHKAYKVYEFLFASCVNFEVKCSAMVSRY